MLSLRHFFTRTLLERTVVEKKLAKEIILVYVISVRTEDAALHKMKGPEYETYPGNC